VSDKEQPKQDHAVHVVGPETYKPDSWEPRPIDPAEVTRESVIQDLRKELEQATQERDKLKSEQIKWVTHRNAIETLTESLRERENEVKALEDRCQQNETVVQGALALQREVLDRINNSAVRVYQPGTGVTLDGGVVAKIKEVRFSIQGHRYIITYWSGGLYHEADVAASEIAKSEDTLPIPVLFED
jgi:hypothetical protein